MFWFCVFGLCFVFVVLFWFGVFVFVLVWFLFYTICFTPTLFHTQDVKFFICLSERALNLRLRLMSLVRDLVRCLSTMDCLYPRDLPQPARKKNPLKGFGCFVCTHVALVLVPSIIDSIFAWGCFDLYPRVLDDRQCFIARSAMRKKKKIIDSILIFTLLVGILAVLGDKEMCPQVVPGMHRWFLVYNFQESLTQSMLKVSHRCFDCISFHVGR